MYEGINLNNDVHALCWRLNVHYAWFLLFFFFCLFFFFFCVNSGKGNSMSNKLGFRRLNEVLLTHFWVFTENGQKKDIHSKAIQQIWWNIARRFKKALFTVSPLSRKSIVMGPFTSWKTINMNFFYDLCTRNFFISGELVYFHSMN